MIQDYQQQLFNKKRKAEEILRELKKERDWFVKELNLDNSIVSKIGCEENIERLNIEIEALEEYISLIDGCIKILLPSEEELEELLLVKEVKIGVPKEEQDF